MTKLEPKQLLWVLLLDQDINRPFGMFTSERKKQEDAINPNILQLKNCGYRKLMYKKKQEDKRKDVYDYEYETHRRTLF